VDLGVVWGRGCAGHELTYTDLQIFARPPRFQMTSTITFTEKHPQNQNCCTRDGDQMQRNGAKKKGEHVPVGVALQSSSQMLLRKLRCARMVLDSSKCLPMEGERGTL